VQSGKKLGTDITLEGLKSDFDAVFLSIGLGGVNSLRTDGVDLDNMSLQDVRMLCIQEGYDSTPEFLAALNSGSSQQQLLLLRELVLLQREPEPQPEEETRATMRKVRKVQISQEENGARELGFGEDGVIVPGPPQPFLY
jgi:hypothetical protein